MAKSRLPPAGDAATQTVDSRSAAGGKDVAIEMVGEKSHAVDPNVTARAVRKIDWFLIPAMTIGVSDRDYVCAMISR